jgi:transcriptional regulator with XRE-family HTH domain
MNHDDRKNGSEPTSLGSHIKRARLAHGLSTRQLSAISGVERSAIIRLEADAIEQPSLDNLTRLARALELDEADVLILAGVQIPTASLDIMLRMSYDLPPEAIARIKQNIQEVIDEHNRP